MSFWQRLLAKRAYLFVPPILIGLAIVAFAAAQRQPLGKEVPTEQVRALTVVEARRQNLTPVVTGYGLAVPAQRWRAVAEVGGRILKTHPTLDSGAVVEGGQLLVQIDPTDYKLTLTRRKAQVTALRAQLQETRERDKNDGETLAIEEEALGVATRELDRMQSASNQNVASASELNTQLQAQLTQRRRVQELRNSLRLTEPRLQQLNAQLAAARADVAVAKRDLDRTTIQAPFDCRVGPVALEPGQRVQAGQELFEVHGLNGIEVEAQFPVNDVRTLVPDQYTGSAVEQLKGLKATVQVKTGMHTQEWSGEVVRIRERVEGRTRTVTIVVAVGPLGSGQDQVGIPLLEGMFCQVDLVGAVRRDQLVVPRSAIRNGSIYVVNGENRLERRSVTTSLISGRLAVVVGDIREGERVVASDPTPAVEGSLIDPVSAPTEEGR